MYTEAELEPEHIRETIPLDELMDRAKKLDVEHSSVVLVTLEGNDWTWGQVSEFAKLGIRWAEGYPPLSIFIHIKPYLGLEIRRHMSRDEMIDALVKAEIGRRQSANWKEEKDVAATHTQS